jgi:hypothetical protein
MKDAILFINGGYGSAACLQGYQGNRDGDKNMAGLHLLSFEGFIEKL